MNDPRLSLGRQVYDYFVARGMAPHQAAAFAGNAAWESGGRSDAVNIGDNERRAPHAPSSFGYSQWNGDRLVNLLNFARRQGLTVPDGRLTDEAYVRQLGRHIPLQTQLDFAWSELQGPERRAYQGVTGARALPDAMQAAVGYHRPSGYTSARPDAAHGYTERLSLAQSILDASRGRPAPVAAAVSGLPPDPLRDERRPALMDTSIAPRSRDESRPTIFSGMMPGYRDGGAVAADIRRAVRETDTNPTDAMKAAGNYKKGRVRILDGLEVAIENPKGSERSGTDASGKTWRCVLPAHYGYFTRTTGRDSDAVDCYIGDTLDSDQVWVVDQIDTKSGRFDEHKCLLCFPSRASALASYEKAFSDGRGKDRIGSVTQFSVSDFKDWLRHGNTRKPAAVAARSGTMSRVGQAAERLARFRGGRVGYADGGIPVDIDSMGLVPPLPTEELPREFPNMPTRTAPAPPSPDDGSGGLPAAQRLSRDIGYGVPRAINQGVDSLINAPMQVFAGIPAALAGYGPLPEGRYLSRFNSEGQPETEAGQLAANFAGMTPAVVGGGALWRSLGEAGNIMARAPNLTRAGIAGTFAVTDPARGSTQSAQPTSSADGLTDAQRARLEELQNITRTEINGRPNRNRRTLTRAEREELNALNDQVAKAQERRDAALIAQRAREEGEQRGERERLRGEAVTERDRIRAEAPKPFDQQYPTAGPNWPWAPLGAGAATGLMYSLPATVAERVAGRRWAGALENAVGRRTVADVLLRRSPASAGSAEANTALETAQRYAQRWPEASSGFRAMAPYAVPGTMGAIEGAAMPNLQQYYNMTRLPAENPERSALQAYYRLLPESDTAERARVKALLEDSSVLPMRNPPQEAAERFFSDGNWIGPTRGAALEGTAAALTGYTAGRMLRPQAATVNQLRARTDAISSPAPGSGYTPPPLGGQPPPIPLLPAPPAGPATGTPLLPPPASGLPTSARPSTLLPSPSGPTPPISTPVPSSEPVIIVRGTDSLGRVYHHRPAGATDADGNRVGGRRHSAPGKKPSRTRRKGPDDDITPEKDGGRVNRADGGNVLTRAVDALRRFMGGRAYADGGRPTGEPEELLTMNDWLPRYEPPVDASEFTDVTDRGLNRAMVMDRMGVDIDAPFGERVAQGFRRELPNMARDAGLALGQRVAPMAPRPSQPSLIQQRYPGVPVTTLEELRAMTPQLSPPRAPSGGPQDIRYLYGLRDFYKMQQPSGAMHADGGAVAARADGAPVVSGPIVGPTGGREDALPVQVKSGSFVIPSDVVSGLPGAGGNTNAGMKMLEAMFGPPAPEAMAAGGATPDVPILISHGEFVVSPEQVAKIGRGDMNAGHLALEKFVLGVRREHVKALSKLPKPARD